jgi:VIT1/CCC1 family predicted Fe2+/Mn2+ transporter
MGATYFRNFIFGVEDSLVSTVGLLSGIAIAGVARETIFLTGVILIFVEAFSMAAGSFLSEASAEEYTAGRSVPQAQSISAGAVMFASYFFAGFIPLFPYLAIAEEWALPVSVSLSIATLFILGVVSGMLTRTRILRSAFRMAIVGGIAIAVGVSVGSLLS